MRVEVRMAHTREDVARCQYAIAEVYNRQYDVVFSEDHHDLEAKIEPWPHRYLMVLHDATLAATIGLYLPEHVRRAVRSGGSRGLRACPRCTAHDRGLRRGAAARDHQARRPAGVPRTEPGAIHARLRPRAGVLSDRCRRAAPDYVLFQALDRWTRVRTDGLVQPSDQTLPDVQSARAVSVARGSDG